LADIGIHVDEVSGTDQDDLASRGDLEGEQPEVESEEVEEDDFAEDDGDELDEWEGGLISVPLAEWGVLGGEGGKQTGRVIQLDEWAGAPRILAGAARNVHGRLRAE
jgi:hypothetical protein